MIEIIFDLPGSLDDKTLKAYMDSMLRDIGAMARAEIIRLAKATLKGTLRDYERGVQPPILTGDSVVIEIVGKMANMVEEGWSGGDMRDMLLKNNPKTRISAEGNRYAYIPFRLGTPRSSGRNTGTAMTASVHKVAKGLGGTVTIPIKKGVKWGEQVPSGLEPKMKAHHKTDIYAGMYRAEKQYAKTTQSSYMTFRTVSEGSDVGWKHPGIQQYGFLAKAASFIEQTFPDMVEADPPINFEG